MPFAGPSSGSIFRMCRSRVHTSNVQPTPQYVHTVFVRFTRSLRISASISRQRQDRPIADRRLDTLDHLDHVVEHLWRQVRQIARVAQHRLFHQRIARADGHAVAAAHAARTCNLRAAIPQHAWDARSSSRSSASRSPARSGRPPRSARTECTGPDRSGRTGLTCPSRTAFHRIRTRLMLHVQSASSIRAQCSSGCCCRRPCNTACGSAKNAVEPPRAARCPPAWPSVSTFMHRRRHRGGARPNFNLPVHLHHARVAALDRPHLLSCSRPAGARFLPLVRPPPYGLAPQSMCTSHSASAPRSPVHSPEIVVFGVVSVPGPFSRVLVDIYPQMRGHMQVQTPGHDRLQ